MAHAVHAAPHVGEHVDDAAAVLAHALQIDFLGHQETADEVGTHHRFEAFLVDADQRGRELAAGVVDQVMDGAVLGDHRLDHDLDRFPRHGCRTPGSWLCRRLRGFRRRWFPAFPVAPDQHHLGAQVGQFVGHAAADAAAAAGDQDGLAAEQAGLEDRVVRHCCCPCRRLG